MNKIAKQIPRRTFSLGTKLNLVKSSPILRIVTAKTLMNQMTSRQFSQQLKQSNKALLVIQIIIIRS